MSEKISRRNFLRLSAMTVGGMVVTACATPTTTELQPGQLPTKKVESGEPIVPFDVARISANEVNSVFGGKSLMDSSNSGVIELPLITPENDCLVEKDGQRRPFVLVSDNNPDTMITMCKIPNGKESKEYIDAFVVYKGGFKNPKAYLALPDLQTNNPDSYRLISGLDGNGNPVLAGEMVATENGFSLQVTGQNSVDNLGLKILLGIQGKPTAEPNEATTEQTPTLTTANRNLICVLPDGQLVSVSEAERSLIQGIDVKVTNVERKKSNYGYGERDYLFIRGEIPGDEQGHIGPLGVFDKEKNRWLPAMIVDGDLYFRKDGWVMGITDTNTGQRITAQRLYDNGEVVGAVEGGKLKLLVKNGNLAVSGDGVTASIDGVKYRLNGESLEVVDIREDIRRRIKPFNVMRYNDQGGLETVLYNPDQIGWEGEGKEITLQMDEQLPGLVWLVNGAGEKIGRLTDNSEAKDFGNEQSVEMYARTTTMLFDGKVPLVAESKVWPEYQFLPYVNSEGYGPGALVWGFDLASRDVEDFATTNELQQYYRDMGIDQMPIVPKDRFERAVALLVAALNDPSQGNLSSSIEVLDKMKANGGVGVVEVKRKIDDSLTQIEYWDTTKGVVFSWSGTKDKATLSSEGMWEVNSKGQLVIEMPYNSLWRDDLGVMLSTPLGLQASLRYAYVVMEEERLISTPDKVLLTACFGGERSNGQRLRLINMAEIGFKDN